MPFGTVWPRNLCIFLALAHQAAVDSLNAATPAKKSTASADAVRAFVPSSAEDDGGTIMPNDYDRRIQALAKLRDQLGGAAKAVFEAENRRKGAQDKFDKSSRDLANLQQQLGALFGAVNQNQLAQLEGAQNRCAADLKELTDAEIALHKEMSAMQSLYASWFELMDFFDRLSPDDHRRSIATFTDWLKQSPEDKAVLIARALAYGATGSRDKAIDDVELLFKKQAEGAPPDCLTFEATAAECLAVRGWLFYQDKRKRESDAAFTQAKKIDRDCLALCIYQAKLCMLNNKMKGAEALLLRAQKLYPNHPEPLRLLALAQAACDDPGYPRAAKNALKNAKRACEITNGKDWASLEALAAAYAVNARFDEAGHTIDAAAAITSGPNRERLYDWKKEFAAQKPLRLSPGQCAGVSAK